MRLVRLFPILAMATLMAGCPRPITVKNVNEVIHVCHTDVKTVRDAFGMPLSVGMMNGVVTNLYSGMIVAYKNDIVVDVVVNPPGIVELQNRCARHASGGARHPFARR